MLTVKLSTASTQVSIMGENPFDINNHSNYFYPPDNVISVAYSKIKSMHYPVHYIQTYPAKKRGGGLIQQQIGASNLLKTGGSLQFLLFLLNIFWFRPYIKRGGPLNFSLLGVGGVGLGLGSICCVVWVGCGMEFGT